MTAYLTAKALHVIGFVTWFAGLFYVVRLFIYRVEAGDRPAAERAILEPQLALMTRRLWYIITWPGMLFTLGAGSWLAWQYGLGAGWLHAKLGLVALLVGYHLACHRLFRQLARGECRLGSQQLRMWNELPTLLLVAIVFVAVFKSALSALWAVLGLVALGVVLMVAIRLYRRARVVSGGSRPSPAGR
jgi:putative membrane protein